MRQIAAVSGRPPLPHPEIDCDVDGIAGQKFPQHRLIVVEPLPLPEYRYIIDPNRDVSPEYLYNTVETNDGETMSGIITNETANNLTIKDSAGGIKTILRSNIKSINSFEYSLMPVGLEADLSIDEMADLLQFIEESGT